MTTLRFHKFWKEKKPNNWAKCKNGTSSMQISYLCKVISQTSKIKPIGAKQANDNVRQNDVEKCC